MCAYFVAQRGNKLGDKLQNTDTFTINVNALASFPLTAWSC